MQFAASCLRHGITEVQFVLILLFCLLSAVSYGLIFDQITVRTCLEYFTVGHPPLFSTDSHTLLAIKWAVTATWWMGLLLGLALAWAARAGKPPRVSVANVVLPVIRLMGAMFFCSCIMGLVGYGLGYLDLLEVPSKFAARINPERHPAFIATEFMHDTSYLVALIGGWGLFTGVREFRAGRRATIGSTVFLPPGKKRLS